MRHFFRCCHSAAADADYADAAARRGAPLFFDYARYTILRAAPMMLRCHDTARRDTPMLLMLAAMLSLPLMMPACAAALCRAMFLCR